MKRNAMTRTIALLVTIAGTAMPAVAQSDPSSQPGHDPKKDDRTPKQTDRPANRDHLEADRKAGKDRAAMEYPVEFRSLAWLNGRDVLNTQNEDIGTLVDLIIDRGSGQIDYAVVRTGAVLGLGGKDVAVPFNHFRWNEKEETLVLPLEKEQLKAQPEFSKDEWKRATHTGKWDEKDRSALRDHMYEGSRKACDPYDGELTGSQNIRVEGEIVSVDRDRSGDHGEQVVVTVKTKDGGTKKVALGPSWYVGSQRVTPVRGQKVEVEGVTVAGDKTIVARTVRVDGKELTFRATDNKPAWVSAGDEGLYGSRRFLLLSSLKGAEVDCRGVKCGTVDDIIVERNSGDVAFVSIDPDENFLGIADTKRLVPWTVATVFTEADREGLVDSGPREVVHIDATKEMVLASPETPKDLTTLNRAEVVYKAFGMQTPTFASAGGNRDGDWGPWGPIWASIDRDSLTKFQGTVMEVSNTKIRADVPVAKTIRVKTNDGERLVLVMPSAQLNETDLGKQSDTIVVEAYRTTVDGKPYWVAKSIDHNGRRVTLLDDTRFPRDGR